MPPKRSEYSQKLAEQEGRILLALKDIESGRFESLRAVAKLYAIPLTTLRRRGIGIPSRVDSDRYRYKLTCLEVDSLVEWILSLDSRSAAPRQPTIREIANILLVSRGESPLSIVGVN